jgi:hypothetical protein
VAAALLALLETARYRNTWAHHWQPVVVLSLAVLLPLPVVHLLTGMTSLRLHQTESGWWAPGFDTQRVRVPNRQWHVDAGLETVMARLDQWAREHDYAIHVRGSWSLDRLEDGQTVGQVGLFEARPRSIFTGWRLTWNGPRRLVPALGIVCICSVRPAESIIKVDPGFVAKGSAEAGAWAPLLEELKAALHGGDGP